MSSLTREQALTELGQMINLRQKLDDHPGLIETCLEEADRQLRRAPGAERQKWERLETIRDLLLWERCTGCNRDYRHPHLCREHRLCGLCHPPMESP
jgi:hypothetical protein